MSRVLEDGELRTIRPRGRKLSTVWLLRAGNIYLKDVWPKLKNTET